MNVYLSGPLFGELHDILNYSFKNKIETEQSWFEGEDATVMGWEVFVSFAVI